MICTYIVGSGTHVLALYIHTSVTVLIFVTLSVQKSEKGFFVHAFQPLSLLESIIGAV